jgi:hypothetical protein
MAASTSSLAALRAGQVAATGPASAGEHKKPYETRHRDCYGRKTLVFCHG